MMDTQQAWFMVSSEARTEADRREADATLAQVLQGWAEAAGRLRARVGAAVAGPAAPARRPSTSC